MSSTIGTDWEDDDGVVSVYDGRPVFRIGDHRTHLDDEEFDEDNYHACSVCGEPTINARIRSLKDFRCITCKASQPYLGCMDYSHKTGGVLQFTSNPEIFRKIRKPIDQQR